MTTTPSKKRRRFPLFVTLIPLVAGLLAYHYWWQGQREAFNEDLKSVIGRPVEIGGFPYRLEADLKQSAFSRITPMVTLRLSADGVEINRAPIGRPLTVISALNPIASLQLADIAASRFAIAGTNARSSLRMGDNRIVARSSTAFTKAVFRAAAFANPASADTFEVHVRETPQILNPSSKAPTFPEQAELVFQGEGVRYAKGDPVTLSADFGINARAPLATGRAALAGATLELKKAELSDKQGVIATFVATASPDAGGNVLVSGTVTTVCPKNVLALLNGTPGAQEFRQRRAVRIAYSGALGAVAPAQAVTDAPVRNQEPPCPVLRR